MASDFDSPLVFENDDGAMLHYSSNQRANRLKTLKEVNAILRMAPNKEQLKNVDKGNAGSFDFMPFEYVVLGMIEAFDPTGWDVAITKFEIIERPHKINDVGPARYRAMVLVGVKVTARAIAETGGSYVEVSREDYCISGPFGDKSASEVVAINGAFANAYAGAVKRACKLLGPRTGLLTKFDERDRDFAEAKFSADIEHDLHSAPVVSPPIQAAIAQTVNQANQLEAQPVVGGANVQPFVPTIFAQVVGQANMEAIAATVGDMISKDLAGQIHMAFASLFSNDTAFAMWRLANVTPGNDAKIFKNDLLVIAQYLEEASAKAGGVTAFIESMTQSYLNQPQLVATAAPTAPVAVGSVVVAPVAAAPVAPVAAPAAPVATAPVAPAPVATAPVAPAPVAPAPVAPAPVAAVMPAPVAAPQATQSAVQATATNPIATNTIAANPFASAVTQSIQTPQVIKANREAAYARLAKDSPELFSDLVNVEDSDRISPVSAAMLHSIAQARFLNGGQRPEVAFSMWKEVGHDIKSSNMPTGKMGREYASKIPA